MFTAQDILSKLPYPVSFVDLDYTYRMVNNVYSKFFDVEVDNIVGKKVSYFLGEDVFENSIRPNMDRAFSGEDVNYEIHLVLKNGNKIYMNMYYTPYRDKNNKIIGLISHGEDIYHQKNLEEQLKFNKLYLESIFSANPNIMVVSDGENIDLANRAMLEFFDYKNISEFKKEHDCICDYFVEKDGFLKSTYNSNSWSYNSNSWLNYILNNKNDKFFVAMKNRKNTLSYFLVRAEKLQFDNHKRSVVVFSDITNEINIKDNLIENEKILTDILDVTLSGYWDWNLQDNSEYLSPGFKAMFGYRDDEMSNTVEAWQSIILKEDLKILLHKLNRHISSHGKFPYSVESRYYHKNGSIVWVLCIGRVIEWLEDGSPLRMVGCHIDITKQKDSENKLKEQESIMLAQSKHAAMGEMINMIAHQWRQPLSTIAMEANNILADIELETVKEKELKHNTMEIVRHTQELSHTIEDFQNFFKPQKEKESVYIPDIFRDTLKVIGKSLENQNIVVIKKYNIEREIHTYPRELMQVFINIIKNAQEALNKNHRIDKKIFISIKDNSKKIEIEICNNGEEISTKIIDKIFNPYFTTKKSYNGKGLGLYISKTIIEKHLNGTLGVYNIKNGVCFKINIKLEYLDY